MTQFFKDLYMKLFNTTTWLNLNIGFWLSMFAVAILVVLMIVVFYSLKPKKINEK